MKAVLSAVRQRFRNVKHLSTATLAEWMKESRGEHPGEGAADEKREVVLLDTRPVEEYVVSHLPQAVRVDPGLRDMSYLLHTLPDWLAPGTGLEKTQSICVVCYCSLGYRSSSMAERLQDYLATISGTRIILRLHVVEHFFPTSGERPAVEVYNLEGSLFKWANEGRPMVDSNDQPTIYAHPYSAIWGRLLSKQLRKEKPS